MPKTTKERPKHATSLSSQLQNDRNPLASQSKRSKRKRDVQEREDLEEEDGEQVVSGKLGRQIMTMAREQQEALEDGDEDGESDEEEEDTMQWRDSQM
jgi:hypothetical protein